MAENLENDQDVNLDEELDLDLELDDTEETVSVPKSEYEKLQKKAKAIPQYKARLNALKSRPQTITKQEEPKDFFEDERLDLLSEGYSKDTIKFIMTNGGRKSLEDPNSFVSIAVKAKQEQLRAERAAQATDDTSGLSEVERKYTPEQLANMSTKELEQVLPHAD